MKKLTKEEFIEKAKKNHGDKYDYSKVEYVNCKTKVCIICPIHGEFWQTPDAHLNGKSSCPYCIHNVYNTQDFIRKAKEIHKDRYDYSKVKYINTSTKVCIICPIHGEFWQTPNNHLQGQCCPICSKKHDGRFKRLTTEEFIERAREIHGDKYDYSKVKYVNNHTKICIICPIHGEFWQIPNDHLSNKSGCPQCKSSKLENEIRNLLKSEIIQEQKKFDWLGLQTLDFYLPQYNCAIECQGKQHFGLGGWKESFKEINERDSRKFKLCSEHDVKLLYYSDLHINYPYEVFEDKEKLLKEIKKYENK